MVADDPFTERPPSIHDPATHPASAPSPILRVQTPSEFGGPSGNHSPEHAQTAPVSGGKTPRRVQWTADHVINLAPLEREETNVSQSSDAQDDQELSHAKLRQVNAALETFKKRRQIPSQLSITSMVSSDASDDDQVQQQHQPHRPQMHHSHEPRHDAHHAHGQSDDDYDYRLDKDPEDQSSDHDDQSLEHQLLDSGVNDHVYTYVPLGETDGLPTRPTDESVQAAATDLVRSHSRWGSLRRRVKSGSVRRAAKAARNASKSEHKALDSVTEEKQQRDSNDALNPTPPQHMPGGLRLPPGLLQQAAGGRDVMPGGQSVLSSLLTLYHQQQMDSGGTTPGSTRPPSLVDSPAASDADPAEHDKKSRLPWKRRSGDWGDSRRQSMVSIADREPTPSSFKQSVRSAYENIIDTRPKAARSSAGVFGALIQSTGAVAAAAAPTASTLIPAAKQSGYHLQRYELGSAPTPKSPAYESRSSSRGGSRPNSRPPSRRQSADFSTVGDSSPVDAKFSTDSQPPRAKSTDNLIEMKRKEKKHSLRPLNLKTIERNAEKWIKTPLTPGFGTPRGGTPHERTDSGDYFAPVVAEDERRRKEWEADRRKRKKAKEARKKQEVFIIQHVAAILARQQFLLKLARALMMFGSPSHRLETQIQTTARVLEINAQVVYLPNIMLISFQDDQLHSSEVKFLKQTTGLDLQKLLEVHEVYWDVVHDRVSVDEASKELDRLMTSPQFYGPWWTIVIGGFCSAIIVIPSFHGSFIDALMAAPLGMMLCAVQMLASRNELLGNVFELVIATLISFLAAVLASTHQFCYTALVSGGVVLILPGYIVLCGALELSSRNITAGAVRLAYSVFYSLILGFGISIGAEVWQKIRGTDVTNATNWQCDLTHVAGSPWYRQTPSPYWYFLAVPAYATVLSLRNQQPICRKELPIMVLFACAGWVVNYFSAKAFPGRSDIVSALGSFTVGILGNLYGRFFRGASFPVMVTGILFQLPSGLSQGGIFNFAANNEGTDSQYSTGFSVAQQLVSVAIGLTVGLFIAAVVTHPLGGSRRRGAGIFSF